MMMNYENLDLNASEKRFFYSVAAATGLFIGWLFYNSIQIGIVTFVLLTYLKPYYISYLLEKRRMELLYQFKDFLYSMASSVSMGRSIGQGIKESYTFWLGTYNEDDYIMSEIKEMINKMEQSNARDVDLIEDFALRTCLDDASDVAMICRTCKKTGGNAAEALNKSIGLITDRINIKKELSAIVSQKRLEGRIVAAAPFLMVSAIKLLSPSYLEPLTKTMEGRIVSTISLIMIVLGWIAIEKVNVIEI